MARVVTVHGIGQQFLGPTSVCRTWIPALQDGVIAARATPPDPRDISCAFYGDMFRPGGKTVGIPSYTAADVRSDDERDLLRAWWIQAARVECSVPGPDTPTKVRTPEWVQRALNALSHSRTFGRATEAMLIGAAKQVSQYFRDRACRERIRGRVAAEIAPDTEIVVAHSLGTVVAYEVLADLRRSDHIAFVTLGSPLGVRNIVFDRLEPAPQGGMGVWPRSIHAWTNVADIYDVVALAKKLAGRFAGPIRDVLVSNGPRAHDVLPYLTAKETGHAIAAALGS
jgi:hypothetical protein